MKFFTIETTDGSIDAEVLIKPLGGFRVVYDHTIGIDGTKIGLTGWGTARTRANAEKSAKAHARYHFRLMKYTLKEVL